MPTQEACECRYVAVCLQAYWDAIGQGGKLCSGDNHILQSSLTARSTATQLQTL